MGSQAVLSIIFGIILAAITLFLYITRKTSRQDEELDDKMTTDKVLTKVKAELVELSKEQTFFGKKDSEWEALYNRKKRIQHSLRNCVHGIPIDRINVIDLIKNIAKDILPTIEAVNEVIDFDSPFLDPYIKYEILIYKYSKREGPDGYKLGPDSLATMIEQYGLDKEKHIIEDGTKASYAITIDDIDLVYSKEVQESLAYNERLDILALLLYSQYKGFGCVDTLYQMNIDGFNVGTSGSVLTQVATRNPSPFKLTESVWLYFKGKYIHLRFLNFYTEEEMRRITLLLCRWNNPGPLTEKRGFLVNTTGNKSRILALRPGASECWSFFLRKFTLKSQTLESLVDPYKFENGEPVLDTVDLSNDEWKDVTEQKELPGVIEVDLVAKTKKVPVRKYKNGKLPLECIRFLMKGQVTCAFTGRQGCGKTTLMTAAIEPVDARFNIRVLEMAPEMYLRELYPERNILSVQETATVTAQDLQDALKKSDAALSIVGEVATDIIAARMLQMGQIASIFTIFSHHAIRAIDLINGLTNSVVAASGGNVSPETIMPQVLDVVKVDIHLDYTVKGDRYIERVTEIRRKDKEEYPKWDKSKMTLEEYNVTVLQYEYYTRSTDRELFTTTDIIKFDKDTFTYYTCDFFSSTLCEHIMSRLDENEIKEFIEFNNTYWGGDAKRAAS